MPKLARKVISSKLVYILLLNPYPARVEKSKKHQQWTQNTISPEKTLGPELSKQPSPLESKDSWECDGKVEQQWKFLSSVVDRTILFLHIVVYLGVLCFFYVQIKE